MENLVAPGLDKFQSIIRSCIVFGQSSPILEQPILDISSTSKASMDIFVEKKCHNLTLIFSCNFADIKINKLKMYIKDYDHYHENDM